MRRNVQIVAGIAAPCCPFCDIRGIAGFVEAWDFTDFSKLWTNTGRTTQVTTAGDLVAVADGLSGNASGRAANTGGTDRPLVVSGGLQQVSGDYLLAPLAAASTTEITIGVRFRMDAASAENFPGLIATSTTGVNDFASGSCVIPNLGSGAGATTLNVLTPYSNSGTPGDLLPSTVAFGTFCNVIFTRNSSGFWTLYLNGTSVGSGTGASGNIELGLAVLFARYEGAVSRNGPFTIAKSYIYRTVLSSGNIANTNAWLG